MKKTKIGRARALAVILTAGLLCVLLVLLQSLVVPKYRDGIPEGLLIGEYYDAEEKHNVLFVGDCEVYESFSTVTLWEEYGISSYIRGSAQQLIWQSYYLLEEMIARGEAPEVAVFNVLSMKYDTPQHEEYNRMTLDGMELSSHKIDAIRASMTEEEDLITYLFPLLRYHSRISELTQEDFTSLLPTYRPASVSYNGYLMQTGIVPQTDGTTGPASPYPDALISDVCFDYLERMRVLCEENGIELVLVKAPTNNWKYHWYEDWDQQIRAYAEEKDVAYYNFIGMDEEIGLDFSTDTYDGGIHLNIYGAEKMSLYFGKILRDLHDVSDLRSDPALSETWKGITERYYEERNSKE